MKKSLSVGGGTHISIHSEISIELWAVGGKQPSVVLHCVLAIQEFPEPTQVSLGPGAIDNSFAQTSKRPVALDCRQ